MKPTRLSIAQIMCRYLPPILAQTVRNWVYPQALAFSDDYTYIVSSQTGSSFTSSTGDFHGHVFAVHGYFNWRAWAIARVICNPGDTILEVGANIGTETVGFADIVGCRGHVFAFEPLPSNIEASTKSLKLRTCPNVTLMPIALSDRNENIAFRVPESQYSSGTGRILSNNATPQIDIILVECRSLDSLQESILPASFVFMDVEGAEYSVLKGGQTYFQTHKPAMIVEASAKHLKHFDLTLRNLYDYLGELGYVIFDITRFGLAPVRPEDFSTSTSDWLCIQEAQVAEMIPKIKRALLLSAFMPCIPGLNPISRKG